MFCDEVTQTYDNVLSCNNDGIGVFGNYQLHSEISTCLNYSSQDCVTSNSEPSGCCDTAKNGMYMNVVTNVYPASNGQNHHPGDLTAFLFGSEVKNRLSAIIIPASDSACNMIHLYAANCQEN